MSDEALQASLRGRPRQAPDFSPLALEHLHSSCLAVRQLIKLYIAAPSKTHLKPLITAVNDIHHTLRLLDRQGALLVTTEVLELLDAMDRSAVDDDDACAQTLVFAGERLADYVAHLRKPGSVDSALPLLPVINNCRACRGEELLSEMLVVASGINLPDASSLPLPGDVDINAFLQQINQSRKPLMAGLIGWFRDEGKLHNSLSELAEIFARLAETCDAPTSLQPMVPLFECAEFICQSVRKGGLDNSAALHKLFAQLERLLDTYSKLDPDKPELFAESVPKRLFLNLLYYVALSTETSAKAVVLRRRFRLDRFMDRGIGSDRSQVEFEGVGDRLADSIRDAIELETEAARAWLVDAQEFDAKGEQTRQRLMQLEPAIMLLGAPESRRQLISINAHLEGVSRLKSDIDASAKERIADALIRLERALDTELNVVRISANGRTQTDLDSILAACLTEAQLRLLAVEDELVVLFPEAGSAVEVDHSVELSDSLEKLKTIDSALQILPLPEVSPLLQGVQAFLSENEGATLGREVRRDLATVMVSLGYYLNSVLQPNGAAGQLLLEAEEALLNLNLHEADSVSMLPLEMTSVVTQAFDETTAIVSGDDIEQKSVKHEHEYDETIVDVEPDTVVDGLIEVALQQLSVINAALPAYRANFANPQALANLSERSQLITAYDLLASEAVASNEKALESLSLLNVRLLECESPPESAADLLEESAAVLPQLINQLQSTSDKVFGFSNLLDRLDDAVAQDLTQAFILDEPTQKLDTSTSMSAEEDVTEDATEMLSETVAIADLAEHDLDNTAPDIQPIALDDLPDMSLQTLSIDGDVVGLDSTLEHVFFRECEQHLTALRRVVGDALNSKNPEGEAQRAAMTESEANTLDVGIDPKFALPNRDMLRALHTLTGSAQTMDAATIIAIAQPVQKAALNKQRHGDVFTRPETQYIAELITVLESRVDSLANGRSHSGDDAAVQKRLNEFGFRSVKAGLL